VTNIFSLLPKFLKCESSGGVGSFGELTKEAFQIGAKMNPKKKLFFVTCF